MAGMGAEAESSLGPADVEWRPSTRLEGIALGADAGVAGGSDAAGASPGDAAELEGAAVPMDRRRSKPQLGRRLEDESMLGSAMARAVGRRRGPQRWFPPEEVDYR